MILTLIPNLTLFENYRIINSDEKKKYFFHIYINGDNTERNVVIKDNKITKIKVIIDYKVNSLQSLFKNPIILKR